MITSINGLNIDYDKLGQGFIDILDDDEKACLAFGMIDHDKFEYFMKLVYEKVVALWKAQNNNHAYYGLLESKDLIKALKKEFKSDIEHKISCAIYKHGNLVV